MATQRFGLTKQSEDLLYTTIIDNFPERIQILFDRSRAYEQSGNLQKALDDLNNVICIYPKEYSWVTRLVVLMISKLQSFY